MAGEWESLDADEAMERRRHRHWYDRLMMLADGVFAIAITFLAVDIAAPASWSGRFDVLWSQLAPQLNGYAMSFLVISIYWLAHRRFMAMILTVDAPVTVLTLILLGLVVLLPPATRMINGDHVYPASRLVYAAVVVAIGGVLAALWGYAALIAKVVSDEVSRPVRWFLLMLIVVTPSFFLLLTMTLPDPPLGAIPFVLVALFLIGWRMRLWVLRRLGASPYVG